MPGQRDETSPSRDAITGRVLKIVGIVLIVAGIAWLLIGRVARIDAPFLVLNWHVPAILLGLFLRYRGKQYVARSRPAEWLEDSRPPVVYLRPFKEDASTIARVLPGLANPALLLSTFSTFEEQLREALRPIGPLVALAHPGRGLPKPGAARFYASDEDWRTLVAELLNKARLVVLHPGLSGAMRWEITKALEIVSPAHLLLLFHETGEKEYKECSRLLEPLIGAPLPRFRGGTQFIVFEDDWSPRLLPMQLPLHRWSPYKNWRRMLNHTLEPIFSTLGVPWKPSPISAIAIVYALLVLALIAFFILIFTTM